MPTATESISVAEVLEMHPGDENNPTWLNDVVATVLSIASKTTRTNKPYWPCELVDTVNASAVISMTVWQAPRFKQGDTINITGKGARLTEYEGHYQITLGKQSEVHVTNAGGGGGAGGKPAARRSAPANERQEANLEDRPAAGAGSPADRSGPAAAGPINGQTVGMAVKAAVDILIHNAGAVDGPAAPVDLPTLQKKVETIAMTIISASRRLEAGKVAAPDPGEDVPF